MPRYGSCSESHEQMRIRKMSRTNRNAEMPAVQQSQNEAKKLRITRSLFSLLCHRLFSRAPSWAVADVEQRGVSRGCRGFRIVIHPVSAATADAGPGCHSRLDRTAPDALSEHWKRQSPDAEAPSLGLHDRPSYRRECAKYLGFTFGFKWLLIALALIFAGSLQRRFFLAALSLIAVAFSFQFTIEVLANQKFIHIWVIIANLFVAFGLWRLWRFSLGGTTLPGKFVAAVLFLLVISGGIIDFFPIHNTGWGEVTYRNDPLIDWLKKNTSPRDIFLTDRFVNHPILMAGRRVFYGWPYYAWSAGYNASKRDRVYTELFESKDPWKVYHLLKENGIKYVAYDNAVRQAQFIKRPNQELYATYFPKVYEADKYNGYGNLQGARYTTSQAQRVA